MPALQFQVLAADSAARRGRIEIRGRRIDTPAFMPVGTAGTVKGLGPEDVASTGTQILLANTYHLRLRPGHEVVRTLGGLHRFMNWDGAILTDSGGYQIFSLASRVAIDESGALFQSHLDGEKVLLTPEEVVAIQAALDPDVAMVLDQPVALPATAEQAEAAAARTLRWAQRSLDHHRATVRTGQALFGIVQGALDVELRARQARELTALGFDGYALGGLAVGESKAEMAGIFDATLPLLPADQPRYVMGIGYPDDLLAAIAAGADMFDCVLPTRHARTGQAFTSRGVVRLRNHVHRTSTASLDPDCACPTCRGFELGYLAHLYHAKEMLGPILVARHNVHFYQSLVRGAREAIERRAFADYRARFLAGYGPRDASDGEPDEAADVR